MLVVVCGLQGTGKSEMAKLLSQRLNAQLFSTDALRKEQDYHFKARLNTYQTLFKLTKELLKKKKNVILDGTFYKESLRKTAKEIAQKLKTKIYFIEVICDEKKIKERIEKRFKKGTSKSKANYLVYLKYKKLWQPIKEKHIIIDNSGDLKDLRSKVENLHSRLTWGGQNNLGKSLG
jgi:hypothetical protein